MSSPSESFALYFDYVIPFWLSLGLLSLCQGVVVALPRAWSPAWMARLHSRLWALVPALSVIGFVAIGLVAERASAQALTYIALVGVPILAALALGWLMHGARPGLALLVAPLFVLAWADRGGLAGQGAAVILSALSCVALGVLIAGVTPARWLALGIVAMAIADSALGDLRSSCKLPNNALNVAHPVGGLPRLQSEVFGSAVMGYGDLFVAGVFGGLLACLPVPFRVPLRRGAPSQGAQWSSGCSVLRQSWGFSPTAHAGQSHFDMLFFAVERAAATTGAGCGGLGDPFEDRLTLGQLLQRQSPRGERARALGFPPAGRRCRSARALTWRRPPRRDAAGEASRGCRRSRDGFVIGAHG